MHTIIMTDWRTHSRQLSAIRIEVFVEEQQISIEEEWDGLDETAIHFLVQDKGETIGCARLLIDELNQQKHFHIGRVAVLKSFRTSGIGKRLMEFILSYCWSTATYPIYLHAQIARRAFYERLGFIAKGEEFMDAGIPHITMYWQPQPTSN